MSNTSLVRLGPNSLALSYLAGSTVMNILDALNDALPAQGWTLHDSEAGVNARCYKAPVADGAVAYKYLVIDLNSAGYLLPKVYEGWDATTHVGTNIAAYSNNVSYNQQLTLTNGGVMYLFANARYALFYSKTGGLVFGSAAYTTFSGCVEISRDNQDEVPGVYPSFGWVNGALMLGALVSSATMYCMSLPRTRTGSVGTAASSFQSIGTIVGRSCALASSSVQLAVQLPMSNNPISAAPGSNFVFTPYSIDTIAAGNATAGMHIRGRLYGLKILARSLGTPLDSIEIKTDTKLFFDPNSIVSSTHIILSEGSATGRFAIPL